MLATTVVRQCDVLQVPTEDAIMFMDVESGHFLMLEKTARDIWNLVDGQRSVAQIIDCLVELYEVEAPECEEQVKELFETLRAQSMVEIVE